MPVPCLVGCQCTCKEHPMTPIQKVAGIGQALAAHLAAIGITTAEQLAKTSPETLRSIPRLGAQRASGLLAAAQRIVAGFGDEATVTALTTPVASAEATSAVPDEASAPQVKTGKKEGTKAASAKSAKKAATLEKATNKKAEKAEKADAEKTAKKVSAKPAKAASKKKAKAEKAPEKKVAKAPKSKAKKATKVKAEKPTKAKKKSKKK